MSFLIVFIGAGLGGMARHGVNIAALRWAGSGFPSGTLFINILGSLLMGAVTEYFVIHSDLPQPLRAFLTTGILGGFTTFSAFSLEIVLLWQRGHSAQAIAYAVASVLISVMALFAGMTLARTVAG